MLDAPSYTNVNTHTHARTLMGGMCHIIMLGREVGQRIMWGNAISAGGVHRTCGPALGDFCIRSTKGGCAYLCSGGAAMRRLPRVLHTYMRTTPTGLLARA